MDGATGDLLRELLRPIPMSPAISAEGALEHVRSALGRGLPEITGNYALPVSGDPSFYQDGLPILTVAGGGPSLAETMGAMKGVIGAVNGSAKFLVENGIIPHLVAVCDPMERLADALPIRDDIEYFIASRCHPRVFDRLEGRNVKLWHCMSHDDPRELLKKRGAPWGYVQGGSTIGMRLIALGYGLGFRAFHCHGMDSSFRWAPGLHRSHAYPDGLDRDGQAIPSLIVRGYFTHACFAQQVPQFIDLVEGWTSRPDFARVAFEVFGDGLLQHCYREWLNERKPNVDRQSAVA